MSNRFYFGASDSGSENGDNDGTDLDPLSGLPFPKPLNRAAFLADDFEPARFLAALSGRFQTLEDLQTELRDLSQTLNKELIDLVNDNYQDFLSLGLTLSGGEDKIEEVRVGLLGFQRDILGVRENVESRHREIEMLVGEAKKLKRDVGLGRLLLEIAERTAALEGHLKLKDDGRSGNDISRQNGHVTSRENSDHTWPEGWDEVDEKYDSADDGDGDEDDGHTATRWLFRRTEEFLIVRFMTHRPSVIQHPFVAGEHKQLKRIQDKLLMEIDVAIKNEPDVKAKQRLLQVRSSIDGDD